MAAPSSEERNRLLLKSNKACINIITWISSRNNESRHTFGYINHIDIGEPFSHQLFPGRDGKDSHGRRTHARMRVPVVVSTRVSRHLLESLLCRATRRFERYAQGSPHAVAHGKDLPVVVNVVRVVDRVVFRPHDWVDVPIHGVVNVRGPNGGEKEQGHVGRIVAGQDKHGGEIGRRLQNAVEGVKGDGRPGRERFGLVVLVMQQVNVVVHPLVGVQGSMHPVNSNLDDRKVEHHAGHVRAITTNLFHCKVRARPSLFDREFIYYRQ